MGTLIWGVESVCPPVIAEFPPTSCSSTVFRPGLRSEDTPLHPRCRWAPPPSPAPPTLGLGFLERVLAPPPPPFSHFQVWTESSFTSHLPSIAT